MATTAQLYTRIILDTNRDDMGSGGELEQAKIDAVADAVEYYANEPFWFNRTSGTKATVASTATIALPTGMRVAESISYQQSYLRKVRLEEIQYLTQEGQPTQWAENDGAIQLYPIPDAVYTLTLYGLADLGVPASGSSNEWTTSGYQLILAAAKKRLCRGRLRDLDGYKMAAEEEAEALAAIRAETRRRGITGLVSDLPARAYFNINTG